MPSMQPGIQDLHVDALLTNLSIAYMNDPSNFISDKLFPIVPVRKQSDIVPRYGKDEWFRDEAKMRAPGTESAGSGFTTDVTMKYFCNEYAFHKDIPDELRDNADAPFNPDVDATAFVSQKALLVRENCWAANFFATGIWKTDVVGGTNFTPWSDYALSDPIADIETAKDTIFANTGVEAVDLAMGRQAWTKMKHHPDFLERIKYTQRAVLTADLIASLLDLRRILVGQALKAANGEGAANQTLSFIWGKHALLMYVTDGPSLLKPTAGYTFHWNRQGGISYIRRVRDDKAGYDRIEIRTNFDQKVISNECGYFFSGVVS